MNKTVIIYIEKIEALIKDFEVDRNNCKNSQCALAINELIEEKKSLINGLKECV